MDFINEYLIDEALIVIPVLIILGEVIKGTPNIKSWLIPYVLLFFGIAFSVFIIGFNVDAVIQGVLVSGAAVFGYELYKQVKEKEE